MLRTFKLAIAIATGLGFAVANAEPYGFDKDHTKVMFKYNHLGMSNQYGRFDSFDGDIDFNADKMDASRIAVTIDAASVDTDVPKLDEHLRSEDFFNVAKFPKITFKSTEVKQTGARSLQVMGDLTIKGKTKPVVLDATFNYMGDHPLGKFIKAYEGVKYVSFSAVTRVKRTDFDVGQYAPLTSDTIDIIIETELRKK